MKHLCQDGTLFLGLNYWSSRDAIRMWENWDADVIEQDFARIREVGVTHLRVFPLWPVFQPLYPMNTNQFTVEYRFQDGPLPDTEAGRAGVSEQACEHFGVLCDLAEKHGLKLIVALITGHMSSRYFAPPAFEGRNPITDPTLVKWELRYVKYLVKRFASHPAIVGWDLGNECNGFVSGSDRAVADAAYLWCSALSDAIRSVDTAHPVITGFDIVPTERFAFNVLDTAETADIQTVHTYNIFRTKNDPIVSMRPILDGPILCATYRDLGRTPTFLQEIGSIGYTCCSESSEAVFYRALLYSCWAHNCHGVMWWCAFDQGEMDYPPYDWNTIGSDYGFFREDRSAKPIAQACRSFVEVMNRLPFDHLPPVKQDAVCILPDNVAKPSMVIDSTFCLALQANMNVGFVHASQPVPEADVYILPSVDPNHSIRKRRLDDILARVKQGAVLYLSLGEGLFRQLPELTGVTVAYRQGLSPTEKVTLGDTVLSVKADFKYVIEQCDARVLAYGEDGRPVYVKHKYGDGYVYFSTVPMEKHLALQNTVFNSNICPDYAAWYRPLAEHVAASHMADVTSQMVRLTEHVLDENNRYAVVINYSHDRIEASLVIKEGWGLSEVYYGEVSNGVVCVDGGDAVICKLERRSV